MTVAVNTQYILQNKVFCVKHLMCSENIMCCWSFLSESGLRRQGEIASLAKNTCSRKVHPPRSLCTLSYLHDILVLFCFYPDM